MLPDTKSALAAVFLSVVATPALCQAPSPYQTQSPYQDACQDDAMRLCGPVIPDHAKIHSCLLANKASLTPACRAAVSPAKKKRHRQS